MHVLRNVVTNDENAKFLYEKNCNSSCGTGGAGRSPDLYFEDNKECVTSCPDGYYTYYIWNRQRYLL